MDTLAINPSDYHSSWEYTKARSTYHFDKNRVDLPGQGFWVIGRFRATWSTELDYLARHGRGMTWENRKQTIGRQGHPVSAMLAQEEYDIQQGGGDPKMALVDIVDDFTHLPNLKEIVNFFALQGVKARVHVQRTGQVFNMHIDKLDDIYPAISHDQIIRFHVMLQDWEPGQFYQYGTCLYERWSAGDCHWFDWKNVPHCTANASNHQRLTLQVTGIKTERTQQILTGDVKIA